ALSVSIYLELEKGRDTCVPAHDVRSATQRRERRERADASAKPATSEAKRSARGCNVRSSDSDAARDCLRQRRASGRYGAMLDACAESDFHAPRQRLRLGRETRTRRNLAANRCRSPRAVAERARPWP